MLVAHPQGGLGVVALAVEVGDGDLHRVVEDRLGGELHTTVGLGNEGNPKGAVGGSLHLALGHHGARTRRPAPKVSAPRHGVLHPRAADADAAVGRRHTLHGVGLAELRRSALGREADHEARLLILLNPQAEHVAAGAVTHPHRPVACQAVGGQRQQAVGRAEVVSGELELLHLLPVGVKENKVKSMARSQQLALAPVGTVEQHSQLYRVARAVDGAVADHVELRALSVGRRLAMFVDRMLDGIAIAHHLDDAVARRYAVEAVGAVGSGDDGLQQPLVLFGVVLPGLQKLHLLPRHGGARGAVHHQAAPVGGVAQGDVGDVQLGVGHPLGEVGRGGHEQAVLARRQGRQGKGRRAFAVGIGARHVDGPLALGLQLGQLFVAHVLLRLLYEAQVKAVEVGVLHAHQLFALRSQEAHRTRGADARRGDLATQVGALHTPLALGEKGYGGVAVADSLHQVALPLATTGGALVERGHLRTFCATIFADILLVYSQARHVVGHLLHEVEQAPVVPDAQAVGGIARVEVAEALLPLHALPGRQFGAVLHHGYHHVVGRGGHVLCLAAFTVHLYLLHRGLLQHIAVDQCRVVLAQEGMAEGPLEGLQ